MEPPGKDWRGVVFGPGLGQQAPAGDPVEGAADTEIVVRHSPPLAELGDAPGRDLRVRVTVAPPVHGTRWTLQLEAADPDSLPDRARVWWRVEPGTWQPMMSSPQVVASGTDRVRLDIDLRAAPEDMDMPSPELRLTARPAD